jgi:hypothetical protein
MTVFVMPVPDQFRDGVSGIQNMLAHGFWLSPE